MSTPVPEPGAESGPKPESRPGVGPTAAAGYGWGNGSSYGEPTAWIEYEPEPEAEPSFGPCVQWILVTIALIIIVVGTVGNSLVIVVIAKMRTGRTVTDIFLMSLAAADLLVCLICSPLLVVGILLQGGHTGLSYQVEQFLFYFSSVASILNLTAISLDRHDAVVHPMSRRITVDKCPPVLAIIWLISAVTATVIFFLPPEYEFIVLAVCFAVPFASMIFSYTRIVSVATAAERKAAGGGGTAVGKTSSTSKPRKTDKTVKMVVIVVVVFAVSWIPSLVSRLLKYVVVMTPAALNIMEVSACLVAYAGSALNFVVYAFMSRRFKVGLSQLSGCQRFLRKVDPGEGDIGRTNHQSRFGKKCSEIDASKTMDTLPDDNKLL